jgi:hypothetical protein
MQPPGEDRTLIHFQRHPKAPVPRDHHSNCNRPPRYSGSSPAVEGLQSAREIHPKTTLGAIQWNWISCGVCVSRIGSGIDVSGLSDVRRQHANFDLESSRPACGSSCRLNGLLPAKTSEMVDLAIPVSRHQLHLADALGLHQMSEHVGVGRTVRWRDVRPRRQRPDRSTRRGRSPGRESSSRLGEQPVHDVLCHFQMLLGLDRGQRKGQHELKVRVPVLPL